MLEIEDYRNKYAQGVPEAQFLDTVDELEWPYRPPRAGPEAAHGCRDLPDHAFYHGKMKTIKKLQKNVD